MGYEGAVKGADPASPSAHVAGKSLPPLRLTRRRVSRREENSVEDDETHEVYFLVEKATLDQVERNADQAAVRQGIAGLEAGRVVSLDELDSRIQSRIRRPLSA